MRKGKAQTLLSNQGGSQGTLGVGLSVAREERGFCSRAGAARGPTSSCSAGAARGRGNFRTTDRAHRQPPPQQTLPGLTGISNSSHKQRNRRCLNQLRHT